MTTAILTVLWPEDFTIYDYRVCEQIQKDKKLPFQNLSNKSKFVDIWNGYTEFKKNVEELGPVDVSLRDKDRYLFGKSFSEQLSCDIKKSFLKDEDRTENMVDNN